MPRQKAVALQIYIKRGEEEEVKKKLKTLGNPADVEKPSLLSFKNFPEIHFARWLIAPATTIKGKEIGASLIYSANIDGSREDHYKRMIEVAGDLLHDLFSHCEGYVHQARDDAGLIHFIRKRFIKTPAFYVGAPERSVERIHFEARLHEAVADFVNNNNDTLDSRETTLIAIQDWLAQDDVRKKYGLNKMPSRIPKIYWIPALFGWLVAAVILLVSAVTLLPLIHFFYERRLQPLGLDINQLDARKVETMMAPENHVYQNQLSQVFVTKPGLRKVFLWIILRQTNLLARVFFVKGQLMGTPTIHFARWLYIDKGKRFVFFSNFDGSFDEYLGDFVDNNGWGLNAIYGAAKGYPTTTFVFGGGSYKIGEFLAWGRYFQVETQAWYSAYPNLGLEQIINNSLLHRGLTRSYLSRRKTAILLRRI